MDEAFRFGEDISVFRFKEAPDRFPDLLGVVDLVLDAPAVGPAGGLQDDQAGEGVEHGVVEVVPVGEVCSQGRAAEQARGSG